MDELPKLRGELSLLRKREERLARETKETASKIKFVTKRLKELEKNDD